MIIVVTAATLIDFFWDSNIFITCYKIFNLLKFTITILLSIFIFFYYFFAFYHSSHISHITFLSNPTTSYKTNPYNKIYNQCSKIDHQCNQCSKTHPWRNLNSGSPVTLATRVVQMGAVNRSRCSSAKSILFMGSSLHSLIILGYFWDSSLSEDLSSSLLETINYYQVCIFGVCTPTVLSL